MILKNLKSLFLLVGLMTIFASCSKDEDPCGEKPIVNIDRFATRSASDSLIAVTNGVFEDNCLTLVVGYSGCNAGHQIDLLTDGIAAGTNPTTIKFRLDDRNEQLCQAYFLDTLVYDLSELDNFLQLSDSVRIHFVDQDTILNWEPVNE